MKRVMNIVLTALLATANSQAQMRTDRLEWPSPQLPRDADVASAGDHIAINGIPARIYTFSTRASVDDLIGNFREQVEADFTRAKQRKGSDSIDVGGRVGDFWVALHLEEQGRHTRGTWSATPRFIPEAKVAVNRPAGFPRSARLIQQVDSYDAGKRSEMALGIDPAPVDGVALRLEEEMHALGFRKQALPPKNWISSSKYVAVFSKAREEIWVTLEQQRGGTAVSVNRLSALEVLQ